MDEIYEARFHLYKKLELNQMKAENCTLLWTDILISADIFPRKCSPMARSYPNNKFSTYSTVQDTMALYRTLYSVHKINLHFQSAIELSH